MLGCCIDNTCISEPVSGWKRRPPCIPPFVLEIRRLLRLKAFWAFCVPCPYFRAACPESSSLVWPAEGVGSPSHGLEAKRHVPKSLGWTARTAAFMQQICSIQCLEVRGVFQLGKFQRIDPQEVRNPVRGRERFLPTWLSS